MKRFFIVFMMFFISGFVFAEPVPSNVNLKVDSSWAGITFKIGIGGSSEDILFIKVKDDGTIPINVLVGEEIIIIIPPQSIEYEKNGKTIIKTIKTWCGLFGIPDTFEYIPKGWVYAPFISMKTFNCFDKAPLKTVNFNLVSVK